MTAVQNQLNEWICEGGFYTMYKDMSR